jgi:phenylacetic acid degradation operon negative regulatory protein
VTVSSGLADRHQPTVQPLTARSVVLNTLLGYHPPALPVSGLIRVGALFGMADRTIRTAVSRMVGNGDLTVADGVYSLAPRLVDRQARQDAGCWPTVTPWDGSWELAIVTSPSRPLAERVALRRSMARLRLAELREGVWTRPANLVRDDHSRDDRDIVAEQCTLVRGHYEDAAGLARSLWDLPTWAAEARRFRADLDAVTGLHTGFILSAEVIRHLLREPCLPPELLPDGWPADDLRARYADFSVTYAARLRDYSEAA